MLEAGYFQLGDRYQTEADGCGLVATFHPTFEWKVVVEGKTKTLYDYLGCEGVPQLDKVRTVQAPFAEKAGTSSWIR